MSEPEANYLLLERGPRTTPRLRIGPATPRCSSPKRNVRVAEAAHDSYGGIR